MAEVAAIDVSSCAVELGDSARYRSGQPGADIPRGDFEHQKHYEQNYENKFQRGGEVSQ